MKFFNIFKTKEAPSRTKVELIQERGNGFYTWNGVLYKSDIVRATIRPIVKAVGKMTPKHIRSQDGNLVINPEPYMRFLIEEPNPLMSCQVFLEKMVSQFLLNGNAFAVITSDEYGLPNQIYPVEANGVEAEYDNGVLKLVFHLPNGNKVKYPYDRIIHLRTDFNGNDIFGTSPKDALKSLMEVINTTDQGVVKAIKNSNVIKWLLKFKQVLKEEDIEKQTQKFVDSYLNIDKNNGGAAATDPKYDVEQVKNESYVPNALQMTNAKMRLYDFFNVNENIVQSKYSEDEWNAFYESVLEPIAIQLSNEFTRKLFTRRERGFGNRIVFESVSLQYASMQTKLNLQAMVDRGAMTPNEWREILNLTPIEGGDKPIRRLDTATIDTTAEGGDGDE